MPQYATEVAICPCSCDLWVDVECSPLEVVCMLFLILHPLSTYLFSFLLSTQNFSQHSRLTLSPNQLGAFERGLCIVSKNLFVQDAGVFLVRGLVLCALCFVLFALYPEFFSSLSFDDVRVAHGVGREGVGLVW